MIVTSLISETRSLCKHLPEPVGFVPTMGYLHEGHLSLVHQAKMECPAVVASIFVNPTQFSPSEDLSTYPRDLTRDLEYLESAGVDLVWTPTTESMYPLDFQTWVIVEKISLPLEGSMRPGHFRGVATVVAKLFNVVQPEKAYFGQKDAQQVAVIRQMVKDLNFPVEIVVCPIVRESDGLAMSSRNTYLNAEERQAATVLYKSLQLARQAYLSGERGSVNLKSLVTSRIGDEPLARLQYISIADPNTLEEKERTVSAPALVSMAVFIGKTRLIDNIVLEI